jgi:hypothetical protein
VREWILTLPSELPLWELESRWTPKSLEKNYRGQNPLDSKIPYIIENLLERMFKMGSHDWFEWLKHKLWAKERPKIKLSIWLSSTKSQKSPWLPCVQVACHISLESSRRGLQLCFRPHLNQRFAHKVMGLQICGSPILRISKLGSFKTKWHLGVSPMARHKIYYKGEGGGFPQIRIVVSLASPCLHMAHLCTKGVLATH